MKKIIVSLSVIAVAAAVVIGGTYAFFSDTETSTGNVFTAGAIDLKVDSQQHYNNAVCVGGVWALEGGQSATVPQYPVIGEACGGTWGQNTPGVDITGEKFFNFTDIKPGDSGENTVSLHVINNDAWVCAAVSNLTNLENGQSEPEALIDTSTGTNQGELQQNMVWKVWRDDASTNGAHPGDNIYQDGEQVLAEGQPVNGTLAVYDSTTGTGALPGATTGYLGVSWSLPSTVENEVQTDSMTGDISFTVVQSRNNGDFRCVPRPLAFVLTDPSEQNPINQANGTKPWYSHEIDGLCIDFTLHNPTSHPAYFDYAIDGDPGTFVNGVSNVTAHEGPFNTQLLGNLYDDTQVPPGQTITDHRCGNSEIKVAIHYGAEQLWYLDWATFTAQ